MWALAEDDLKDLIEGNKDPESLSTAERKLVPKRSQKAMGILVRCLGEHDHLVLEASTAQEAWSTLLANAKNRDRRGGANLQERLWSVKYQPGMSGGMLAHIAKVRTLVVRMRSISGRNEPSDEDVVSVLLKSVNHVASFKSTCKVLRNKTEVTLEDVIEQLQDQEREDLEDEQEAGVALSAMRVGSDLRARSQRPAQRLRVKTDEKRLCYICNEEDHISSACPLKDEVKRLVAAKAARKTVYARANLAVATNDEAFQSCSDSDQEF